MCLLLLFSGLVGPGWVRCGTRQESNTISLLFAFTSTRWRPGCRAGWTLPGSSGRLDRGMVRRSLFRSGSDDNGPGPGAGLAYFPAARRSLTRAQDQPGDRLGGRQRQFHRDADVGVGGQHDAAVPELVTSL